MIKADIEKRLAGKWIVWWRHEHRAIVDLAGNVTGYAYHKMWRHDRVAFKIRTGKLRTYSNDILYAANDVFVVDGEIAGWPRWTKEDGTPGWWRPITDAEFNELMTRCQPQEHGSGQDTAGLS